MLKQRIEEVTLSKTQYGEDYPGQKKQIILQMIVEEAVTAADSVLLEFTDGTIETLNYLTSAVAVEFAQKAHFANTTRMNRRDIEASIKQHVKPGL